MFRSLRPQSTRGRQAEARRNDLVVLEAARDVFAAQGASAPISAVAEHAGVGMGTLYRRYGSKTELLQRLCVLAMEQALAAADDALDASDPWDGLGGYIRACVELRSGALASLAGQIETTAEMRGTARRSMARMEEIVARAHRGGRLRADVSALDITLADRAVQPPVPGSGRAGRGAQRAVTNGRHRPRRAARGTGPGAAWPSAEPRPLREPLVTAVLESLNPFHLQPLNPSTYAGLPRLAYAGPLPRRDHLLSSNLSV